MARYGDGFVLPIPKKHLAAYRRMARLASKVFREHGALEYVEAVGDDLKVKGVVPFMRMAKAKPSETVVFSFITYKSRAHRDRVNKKMMSDPRLQSMMDPATNPFDMKRMAYGGFRTIIDE